MSSDNLTVELCDAVRLEEIDKVRELLEQGAEAGELCDIPGHRYEGRTPLHLACRHASKLELVKMLLHSASERSGVSEFEHERTLLDKVDVFGWRPGDLLAETDLALAQRMAKHLLHHANTHRGEVDVLDSWLGGMDPRGRASRKELLQIRQGSMLDFIDCVTTLDTKSESRIQLSRIITNKLKRNDINFFIAVIKKGLLETALYDDFWQIYPQLFDAEFIGSSISGVYDNTDAKINEDTMTSFLLNVKYLGAKEKLLPQEEEQANCSLEDKEKRLLAWCAMSGRYQLTHLFLTASRRAVVPHGIQVWHLFNSVAKRVKENEGRGSPVHMEAAALFCQRTARDALQAITSKARSAEDREALQRYLKRSLDGAFGGQSIVSMAAFTQCTLVLAVQGCEKILNESWYGDMVYRFFSYRWMFIVICLPHFIVVSLYKMSFVAHIVKGIRKRVRERCRRNAEEDNRVVELTNCREVRNDETAPAIPDASKANSESSINGKQFFQLIVGFSDSHFAKLTYHVVFHLAFLFLFAHLILVDLHYKATIQEYICWAYVIGFAFEEFKQLITAIVQKKLKDYVRDWWNILDGLSIGFFAIGFFTRVYLLSSSRFVGRNYVESQDEVLYAVRVFYGTSFMLFSLRVLFVFTLNDSLGPKIKMIVTMIVKDLVPFMFILIPIFMSYGVTVQALLFPNGYAVGQSKGMSGGTMFENLFGFSFFAMVGEFQLDQLRGEQCTDNCPIVIGRKIVTYVFLVGYIIITNVLLLNLLIAMFSKTADQVNEESMSLASTFTERIALVDEYRYKSYLPPPLNLFQIFFYDILTGLLRKCRKGHYLSKERTSPFSWLSDGIRNRCRNVIEDYFFIIQAAALRDYRQQLGQDHGIGSHKSDFDHRFERLDQSIHDLKDLLEKNKVITLSPSENLK